MRIAILSSVARRVTAQSASWREKFVWHLVEGLVNRNFEVALFASGDSITRARLEALVDHSYKENQEAEMKVTEYLHLATLVERDDDFDLIHNNFGFQALAFSGLIKTPRLTTIQECLSKNVLLYKEYNKTTFYVASSQAARDPELDYMATIYPGLDLNEFTFNEQPGDYLLFLDPIDDDHGAREAI